MQSYIRPGPREARRALMNFAKEILISAKDSKSVRPVRFASPRSDRSTITRSSPAQHCLIVARQFSARFRSCLRLRHTAMPMGVEGPLMCEQSPDRARHLVGERHDHDIVGSAPEQLSEPRIARTALSTLTQQHRTRALHQQRPYVGITAFADAQQLDPPAGPQLARDQAEIGGELTCRTELTRIGDDSNHRGGSEWAGAGDGHEALALRLSPLPARQLLLEGIDTGRRSA